MTMNDMSTEPEHMNIATLVGDLGQRAKAAARDLAMATADQRNLALKEAAAALRARTSEILAANAKDLDSIKDSGKDAAFVDRPMPWRRLRGKMIRWGAALRRSTGPTA